MATTILTRRPAYWSIIAASVAILAGETSAQVWPYNSSEGTPVETNRLSRSTWLAGADAIWLHHSYAMSVDCSPPRACYAKSQLVNYHFICGRRLIYIRERISMDLNGNVVNHQVFEPAPPSPRDDAAREALDLLCGSPADFQDWWERRR